MKKIISLISILLLLLTSCARNRTKEVIGVYVNNYLPFKDTLVIEPKGRYTRVYYHKGERFQTYGKYAFLDEHTTYAMGNGNGIEIKGPWFEQEVEKSYEYASFGFEENLLGRIIFLEGGGENSQAPYVTYVKIK